MVDDLSQLQAAKHASGAGSFVAHTVSIADLTLLDSEIKIEEFAAYPRPSRMPPLADRLEALTKAYFGLSLPYLATFALAASLIALTLHPYFRDGILSTVLTVAICLVPVIAAALSYLPMRRLAFGASWHAYSAFVLSIGLGVYIAGVSLIVPTFDPPGLLEMLGIVVVAMSAFPLARVLIALEIRKLGFLPGTLWPRKKPLLDEISRLREKQVSEPTAVASIQ